MKELHMVRNAFFRSQSQVEWTATSSKFNDEISEPLYVDAVQTNQFEVFTNWAW